jgi:hypothetical protein
LHQSTIIDQKVLNPLLFAEPGNFNSEEGLRKAFSNRVAACDGSAVSKIVDAIERREDMLDGHLGEMEIPTLIVWGR